VIDGEAVIWSQGSLNFTALQQRLGARPKTLAGLVAAAPANYVAFDVLAVAGHDARDLPLSQGRALLEELANGWEPPLSLSPTTTDRAVAAQWFEDLPSTGIEGLVIKDLNQPYTPGARSWLKVKHRDVLDVVCGAVIGSRSQPTAIVAGLPIGGKLRIVGRSSVLSAKTGRELGRHLFPPAGAHP
jgi:ATP-dependent DNA ligase